mmetsp:Transcript_11755/g.20965  ORF Transcript_11755/g.20965 Transcript_11755/m.20965 type:complete len:128 (+) Transcript_11755:613-996(+)|eukprot:CAMPEP_0194720332 /NCGR_PEP_ID=MMETSP0296-20130528/11670_1 /TAXON_ID=39354 /ORGANISM="Heterosigma akashiwo, Strain CCMP2393" /LENGTH=127 /DNA_ID=CAMNT_0039622447 /DNA_START=643 /DNA_END=1026 /DNA_ORIENTATION=+
MDVVKYRLCVTARVLTPDGDHIHHALLLVLLTEPGAFAFNSIGAADGAPRMLTPAAAVDHVHHALQLVLEAKPWPFLSAIFDNRKRKRWDHVAPSMLTLWFVLENDDHTGHFVLGTESAQALTLKVE